MCDCLNQQWCFVQTAVQFLEDDDQMEKLYLAKAQAFKAEKQFKNAERALLAINRWDAVVEMYKGAAMYMDYLRLMKRSPEQLPAAQVWVAQQREQEGNYRCVPRCNEACAISCTTYITVSLITVHIGYTGISLMYRMYITDTYGIIDDLTFNKQATGKHVCDKLCPANRPFTI